MESPLHMHPRLLRVRLNLCRLMLAVVAALGVLSSAALAHPAVTVSVSPTTVTLPFSGTRQFAATVTGAVNSSVVWSVNGVTGGSAATGTIDSTGKYTAPAALPAVNPVTITATSVESPAVAGSGLATIRYPIPYVYWYSPSKAPLGAGGFQVNGDRFYPGAVVSVDGANLPTTYVSITQLNVASSFATSGSGNLVVTNPGPAGAVSTSKLLEWGQGITVSITPATASVAAGSKKQFNALVTGTSNTQVYWYVTNGSAYGSINSSGLYTAPATAPPGPVTIMAVCAVNNERNATATVTVGPGVQTVAVTVSPASATVNPGTSKQFTASVTGSSNTAVTWQVNGVAGGSAAAGLISSTGLYTAPATPPGGTVTVTAVSAADSSKSGSASVTVPAPPVTIAVSPLSTNLNVGGTQQFTASITGSNNTAVTWSVNGIAGGNSTLGTITSVGVYTAPAAIPAGSITVTAVSAADSTKSASASVKLIDPQLITVGRFLEQSTFGPTPQLIAHVNQVGIQGFLNEQFTTPESVYPNGNNTSGTEMLDQFYLHLMTGQDQLRQRVIYALGEILVISRNKNYYPNMLIPWQQTLSRNAFGNYRTLLRELSQDASMGNYLDMVNSAKPGISGGANENYARELMQLFSIGLYQLNQDGSLKLNASNQPIPTYTQNDVRQIALALTGWTFGNAGGTAQNQNPNYYPGPMLPLPAYHDTSSKAFLGVVLPANQAVSKDLDDVVETVFNHPNMGPFLAVRLIRGLVTSNPSPGYISRVAAVFNDNGQGVRGDLKAVITAILMDPEARDDSNANNDFGKLRSPVLHDIALFRALGGNITQPSQISYIYDSMGESILNAPSVFGHYSPGYRIAKQTPPLFGPEFQIHGPGELVNRGNFLWSYMSYYQTGIWDLNWLFTLGTNHAACIDAVDNLLLYGRMSSGLRQQLMSALQNQAAAGGDGKMRALTALYLTSMSSEYLVMH